MPCGEQVPPDVKRKAFRLHANSSPDHEKNTRQTQSEGNSTKSPTGTPQEVTETRLRRCETRGCWEKELKCHCGTRDGTLEQKKEGRGKPGELQNRLWSFVNGEAPMSVLWFDGTVGMSHNTVNNRNSRC